MTAMTQEARALSELRATYAHGKPTYRLPSFPTREVRAVAVVPGDVLAHPTTGAAMAVVGVGRGFGVVVAYVRAVTAPPPDASDRLHFTPRELVRRASVGPSLLAPVAPNGDHNPDRRNHREPDAKPAEQAPTTRPQTRARIQHPDDDEQRRDDDLHARPGGIALADHAPHPTHAPDADLRAVTPTVERTKP